MINSATRFVAPMARANLLFSRESGVCGNPDFKVEEEFTHVLLPRLAAASHAGHGSLAAFPAPIHTLSTT